LNQGEIIILGDPIDDAEADAREVETRAFSIDAALHGERLDRALVALVPEFSRSYLQQLVEAGAVSIAGKVVTRASHKVKAGEVGMIELKPTAQSQAFRPEPVPIHVVHEDEHVLVIDKPAGLVVHPAAGNWSGTLLNGLLARDQAAALLPRAGIVHRLDKDTSGLMVVARTRMAMDALVRMIAARDVTRQYVALAHRQWQGASTRTVDAPIGRDPRNRLRMAVVESGKAASTTFELIENAQTGCWVRATLHTGRTHQIRVHMAHIGHPLVADALYGGASAGGLQRQALHAFRLAVAHPVTGALLEFNAPLPDDLQSALQGWGLSYTTMNRKA
jgi:23S rRNA pseudouridine1911/1915/1917 synthase